MDTCLNPHYLKVVSVQKIYPGSLRGGKRTPTGVGKEKDESLQPTGFKECALTTVGIYKLSPDSNRGVKMSLVIK
jgi:hypothetical protein